MPEKLVIVLRRYGAGVIAAAGFAAGAALVLLGLIAVTGCFIECREADVHPEGALLFVAAAVVVVLALTAAAIVASSDRFLGRANLAVGWLVAHGILLLGAADADLVDAASPDLDLQLLALMSALVGAILVVTRADPVPAVVAWVVVVVASIVWIDTIVPISLAVTVGALTVPTIVSEPSGTR